MRNEWINYTAVVSLGHTIGEYFMSRYHTHKRCLKFLRRCYYICRMLGKAMIWLRKSRLKKAEKVLSFFITFRARPWMARKVRKRKALVVGFLKDFHAASKFYLSVSRLVRAVSPYNSDQIDPALVQAKAAV